jgi:hypothetical protein
METHAKAELNRRTPVCEKLGQHLIFCVAENEPLIFVDLKVPELSAEIPQSLAREFSNRPPFQLFRHAGVRRLSLCSECGGQELVNLLVFHQAELAEDRQFNEPAGEFLDR